MKKFYFLGLAMLFGAVSIGHAQVEINSAKDLQAAKDSVAKIDTYQNLLSDVKNQLSTSVSSFGNLEPFTTETSSKPVSSGMVERKMLSDFYNAITNSLVSEQKLTIGFFTTSGEDDFWGNTEGSTTLYIYPPEYTSNNDGIEKKEVTSTQIRQEKSAGTSLVDGNKVNNITIYYKISATEYTTVSMTLTEAAKNNGAILGQFNGLGNLIPSGTYYEETVTSKINNSYLKQAQNIASSKTHQSYYNACINGGHWTVYTASWNQDITNIEKINWSSLDVIETTGESESYHIGCAKYQNLKLTADIKGLPANFTMGKWGEGYNFNGDGYSIESTSSALFSSNSGTIENLGVINGNIVSGKNDGSIKNCYEKPQGTILYDIFDKDGNKTNDQSLSGALGYKLRSTFGMDLSKSELSLAKVTDDNRVYMAKATTHELKKSGAATFYTNIKSNNISQLPSTFNGFASKNIFVYMEDTDANGKVSGDNIVYKNGDAYTCSKAVITDKGENNGIFILNDFTASEVKYERKITADIASVCFPFTVEYDDVINKLGVKNVMQFNGVDPDTDIFWFKYMTGSLIANRPYLVSFNDVQNGNVFDGLKNVKFTVTPDGSLYNLIQDPDAENETVGGEFRGTLVQTTASVLAASQYDIYGYSASGDFVKMADKATFGVCRAYVRSPRSTTSTTSAKSFSLGFMDEDGNVVSSGTTGVNAAVADADAFSVKGGNGAVIITTGKAQKVSVYTVGGSLVKAASVEAGTVTVPVAAGVYIVNGKKVVVK